MIEFLFHVFRLKTGFSCNKEILVFSLSATSVFHVIKNIRKKIYSLKASRPISARASKFHKAWFSQAEPLVAVGPW